MRLNTELHDQWLLIPESDADVVALQRFGLSPGAYQHAILQSWHWATLLDSEGKPFEDRRKGFSVEIYLEPKQIEEVTSEQVRTNQ